MLALRFILRASTAFGWSVFSSVIGSTPDAQSLLRFEHCSPVVSDTHACSSRLETALTGMV